MSQPMPNDGFVPDGFVADKDGFVPDKKPVGPFNDVAARTKQAMGYGPGLIKQGIQQAKGGNWLAGGQNIASGAINTAFSPISTAIEGYRSIPVVGEPIAKALTLPVDAVNAGVDAGTNLIAGLLKSLGYTGQTEQKLLKLTPSQQEQTSQSGQTLLHTVAPLAVPQIAGKTASAVTKYGANKMGNVQGAMTGLGRGFADQAFQGGDAFTQQMRGNGIPEEGIVGIAKDALQKMKDERGAAYQGKLADFSKNTTPMDVAPLKEAVAGLEQKFGIVRDAKGNIIRSTIDHTEVPKIQKIIDMVNDWGSQPQDLTPTGFDMLKRNLDDYYSPSKNSRAFVTDLRNVVKDQITQKVPQYNEMVQPYAKASNLISEIEKTLSLSDRSSVDTGLRKLNQAMREDPGLRLEMAKQLDSKTGGELMQRVAGENAQNLMPNTRIGKVAAAGGGLGVTAYLLGRPELLGILAVASPRLVGEFNSLVGSGYRAFKASGARSGPLPPIAPSGAQGDQR